MRLSPPDSDITPIEAMLLAEEREAALEAARKDLKKQQKAAKKKCPAPQLAGIAEMLDGSLVCKFLCHDQSCEAWCLQVEGTMQINDTTTLHFMRTAKHAKLAFLSKVTFHGLNILCVMIVFQQTDCLCV